MHFFIALCAAQVVLLVAHARGDDVTRRTRFHSFRSQTVIYFNAKKKTFDTKRWTRFCEGENLGEARDPVCRGKSTGPRDEKRGYQRRCRQRKINLEEAAVVSGERGERAPPTDMQRFQQTTETPRNDEKDQPGERIEEERKRRNSSGNHRTRRRVWGTQRGYTEREHRERERERERERGERGERERERERVTDRQTDRQTDRAKDERQFLRETEVHEI